MKQSGSPFHKPYVHPGAKGALLEALTNDNSLFEGRYSKLCKEHILEKYGAADLVLTPSCTDALSMASLLLDLKAGDEVIIPSYTFVSVANTFANRGIVSKLSDSQPGNPNSCPDSIEALITEKTKAIVFMAYGGQSEGIERVKNIANEKGIWLIEDAAHSYDALHKGVYLGRFGHVATFSFHQSKSIHCGQGGMLLINDATLVEKARIISTHGADKQKSSDDGLAEYNWDSLGGEFNLPELSCAFLYGQLLLSNELKAERESLWNSYFLNLTGGCYGNYLLPATDHATSNFSIFYIIAKNKETRNRLLTFLKLAGIEASFHYTGLHKSAYFQAMGNKVSLPKADRFAEGLIRLPLYNGLDMQSVQTVCNRVKEFYNLEL